MTTTEIIEAEHLARWIDGERDTLPNEECTVALWAMRPDLAPAPKITVEDILSRVTSGPLCETDLVSIDPESVEGDDFVDAIFAQSRATVSRKLSLQNVWERIESGPFAAEDEVESPEIENVEGLPPVTEDRTVSPMFEDKLLTGSANNNRWWTRPWVAGGLAAALVLFTLVPSQFETPVSQDSIFARSFEAEEALPAEEVEAKTIPSSKQQRSSDVAPVSPHDFAEPEPEVESLRKSVLLESTPLSPKKKSKAAPVKEVRSESASLPSYQVQREQEELLDDVDSDSVKKQLDTLRAVDGLVDFEDPITKTATLNQLSTDVDDKDVVNSSVSSDVNLQNNSNDLIGNTAEMPTYENTGDIQYEFLDNVDFDGVEEGSLSTPTALMMSVTGEGAATPPSAIEVIPKEEQELLMEYMEEDREEMVVSSSALDSVVVEEVAKESFALPRRKKERSSAGLLSKRQRTSMAEEIPEDSISVRAAESVQDSNGLPLTLTQKQLLSVQQADGEQALLALCGINRPTQSLDILWLASQRSSNVDAISLLRYSSQYDHGDARYLKRNWLYLASLLRQTGQIEEAAKYEQLASSLP